MQSVLPNIVLVGRPNVGKSTLFNRLIRSNRAITHDRPGVTRDRMDGVVRRKNKPEYGIIDTGGITLDEKLSVQQGPEGIRGFEADILRQVEIALTDAAAIGFVVDGRDGLLPTDTFLADHLRRLNLPILCIVNKVDGEEQTAALTADFHSLGFPLLAVSAAHGHNISELADALAHLIPKELLGETLEAPALRLALLGRPNVGKSSLTNALAREERMIVSEVAGTTRDSVDVRFTRDGEEYVFVDTAGLRRKNRIIDTVEKYSANSSIKSASKADVTLLTIDATEGVNSQEKRLVDMLDTRKIPFMIIINKVDLLSREELKAVLRDTKDILVFCSHVPILTVSAKDRTGLAKILPLAKSIHKECATRIPTSQLNRAMKLALDTHQPPMVKGARPKFFYLTQAESEPPTFVFFVSDAERVPANYVRYLEASLRKTFQITHAPLRVKLRSSHKKEGK